MPADDGPRDEVNRPVESFASREISRCGFVEIGQGGVDSAGLEVVDEEVDEQLTTLLVRRGGCSEYFPVGLYTGPASADFDDDKSSPVPAQIHGFSETAPIRRLTLVHRCLESSGTPYFCALPAYQLFWSS